MPKPNQTQSGRAWEYALASELARLNELDIDRNKLLTQARGAFELHDSREQEAMILAAEAAVGFLHEHDHRIGDIAALRLQSDRAGQRGDVRDIVLTDQSWQEIGISAKQRHNAVKHPRLSDTIDFGSKWYGIPCSQLYWNQVRPVFADLQRRNARGERWRDVTDKVGRYYTPILEAFMAEIKRNAVPAKLFQYMIGRFDFYKAIRWNDKVDIVSFNLSGTLQWGRRLPIPSDSIQFCRDEDKDACAVLTLDRGWAMSFRLHNAESKITSSLKFDVTLSGIPAGISCYEVPYGASESLL